MHLLSRVPAERLPVVFDDRDSSERRELHRAVWRTVQRWRRAPRLQPLADRELTDRRSSGINPEARGDDGSIALEAALKGLTERQRKILTLWSQGHTVREIAARLHLPAARVSDDKYKALEKLREVLV